MEVMIMMRTRKLTTRTALLFATLGAVTMACSSSEPAASSEQPITEINCAYRTINSPNGATTADYTNSCAGTSSTSANGSYGYVNCTNAYIWEVSQVDSGTCGGRHVSAGVMPASLPTNQTDCEATNATLYVYGLDTVNDIQYAYTSNVQSKACTWSSVFGCDCTGLRVDGIDLDNWPSSPDGGTASVNGIRVVGQVKDGVNYVKLREYLEMGDGDCCVLAPVRH